jgi:hypothetical protein
METRIGVCEPYRTIHDKVSKEPGFSPSKDAQNRARNLANGTLVQLLTAIRTANLVSAWNEGTVHGFLTTQDAQVFHGSDRFVGQRFDRMQIIENGIALVGKAPRLE